MISGWNIVGVWWGFGFSGLCWGSLWNVYMGGVEGFGSWIFWFIFWGEFVFVSIVMVVGCIENVWYLVLWIDLVIEWKYLCVFNNG